MTSAFDIIGPIMIGPSSSHTAGAVRLGLAGRAVVGGQPMSADITFHGSFAETCRGHGTDVAIVAGLLGLCPDDRRIPRSLQLAEASGLEVVFHTADLGDVHPNTAQMVLTSHSNVQTTVVGSSIGGGNIVVTRINEFGVEFRGENHTLIAYYRDQPGVIAKITSLLVTEGINIATMRVSRDTSLKRALAVIELDQPASPEAAKLIGRIDGMDTVMALPPVTKK